MFCNQTQSEYYGINQSVSIEGIAVDHVSERQNGSNSNYLSYENGSTFHSFMSYDSSQDGETTVSHTKTISMFI